MDITSISLGNYAWDIRPAHKDYADALERLLGLHPVVARLLIARGYDSTEKVRDFLGKTGAAFHDPWLMKDMAPAVDYLVDSVKRRERICVYGDYDADGTTATALVMRFFKFLGLKVDFYIPHRVEEGYGINPTALQKIISCGYKTMLTVDTGATSVEEIKIAQSQGLNVIVTDHHQLNDSIPPAIAVINPSRPDCSYPFPYLTGVGVAYKLITALCEALEIDQRKADEFLTEHLDLVAVGTVSDMAPLIGENRALVQAGLEILSKTTNLGLLHLIEVSKIGDRNITSRDIGFILGPRINAAGRTAHASLAVKLLLTDNPDEARRLAQDLNRLNSRRQRLESEMFDLCKENIEASVDLTERAILVAARNDLHEGLLGLVAGKLAEFYRRPSFVFNITNGAARGSGRTYGTFSIFDALCHCREHIRSFGGHHSACGVRLDVEQLDAFVEAINSFGHSQMSAIVSRQPLTIDVEINASELDLSLIEALHELEPFGEGNPSPVFVLPNVYMLEPPRIVGGNHLKLLVSDRTKTLSAIGFNLGDMAPDLFRCYKRNPIHIVFEPIVSEWNNQSRVEMKMLDIKI